MLYSGSTSGVVLSSERAFCIQTRGVAGHNQGFTAGSGLILSSYGKHDFPKRSDCITGWCSRSCRLSTSTQDREHPNHARALHSRKSGYVAENSDIVAPKKPRVLIEASRL